MRDKALFSWEREDDHGRKGNVQDGVRLVLVEFTDPHHAVNNLFRINAHGVPLLISKICRAAIVPTVSLSVCLAADNT